MTAHQIDNECKGTGEKDAYGKKWDVYNNACQNYEQTKRKAIWMTADSDSSSAPYTYCVKVSDGPECSGTTYGIEFKTESESSAGETIAYRIRRMADGN